MIITNNKHLLKQFDVSEAGYTLCYFWPMKITTMRETLNVFLRCIVGNIQVRVEVRGLRWPSNSVTAAAAYVSNPADRSDADEVSFLCTDVDSLVMVSLVMWFSLCFNLYTTNFTSYPGSLYSCCTVSLLWTSKIIKVALRVSGLTQRTISKAVRNFTTEVHFVLPVAFTAVTPRTAGWGFFLFSFFLINCQPS